MVTSSQIQSLSQLARPMVTAYLNTKTEDQSHQLLVPGCLTWLKKAAKLAARELPADEKTLFQEQLDRIELFLRDRHPHERSLAIFAGAETWESVPLQVKVDNDLRWGPPALAQLLWLVDQHKPYCVLVVDRKGARFLRYQLRELVEIEDMKFEIDISQWKKYELGHVTGQTVHKTRGSQRDFFAHRMEAQYAKLCSKTARQAAMLCKKQNLAAIFLVGADHLIGPMEAAIPPDLRSRVVLIKKDLGRISGSELQRHIEPRIDDWEHQHEISLVTALFSSEQGTVIKIDEALAQLQQGKIGVLVLGQDLNVDLHQCVKCGWADRSADSVCSKCGATRQATTLRDVLPELARKYRSDIEIVGGEAAKRLREAGGMGGWLRRVERTAAQ